MENQQNHSLTLVNREKLSLTGVCEVISVSETAFVCKLKESSLVINGENLKISKLDVESGKVDLLGKVNNIKYGGEKTKEKFFKKLFK